MDSKEEMLVQLRTQRTSLWWTICSIFSFMVAAGSLPVEQQQNSRGASWRKVQWLRQPFCSHSTSSSSCLSLPALEVSSFSFLSCILHLSASVTSLSKVNLFPLPTQGGLCATHPPSSHLSWATQRLYVCCHNIGNQKWFMKWARLGNKTVGDSFLYKMTYGSFLSNLIELSMRMNRIWEMEGKVRAQAKR